MKKSLLTILLLGFSSLCFAQSGLNSQQDKHAAHDHNHDHLMDTTSEGHLDEVKEVVDTVVVTLQGEAILTTPNSKIMIEGAITPYNFDKKYYVEAIDQTTGKTTNLKIEYDGRFYGRVTLGEGANYVEVMLRERVKNELVDIDSASKIIFFHKPPQRSKETIVWLDQLPTAMTVDHDTVAVALVRQLKQAGFTSIAMEAKSAEGYASYRKNDMSGTPYLSETKNVRYSALNERVNEPVNASKIMVEDSSIVDSMGVDSMDVGQVAGSAVDSVAGTAVDSVVDSVAGMVADKNVEPQLPFDLLGAISGAADTLGMKVYAVFNFFTEGNITTRDVPQIEGRDSWESLVLTSGETYAAAQIVDSTAAAKVASGHGAAQIEILNIVPLRKSERGDDAHKKGNRLQYLFTNPANAEVQRQELLRVSEVLKNYPIQGIIIGRCRYDGLDTDFSEVSKIKFEKFLSQRQKSLTDFPNQIMRIEKGGKVVENEYFNDWVEFRASVIADFTNQLKEVVKSYNTDKRKVELSAYVGNWYDKYYGYGVNWASENFRYNEMLGFKNEQIYTQSYATTSFLRSLDFLIVGSFNKTLKRDVALATLLTDGQLPLVVALKVPEQMDAITFLHASEASTGGIMLLNLARVATQISTLEELLVQAAPDEQVLEKPKQKAKSKSKPIKNSSKKDKVEPSNDGNNEHQEIEKSPENQNSTQDSQSQDAPKTKVD